MVADGVNGVVDGLPLIKAASDLKEQANTQVKAKKHSDAISLYERGIAILDQADGKPMLRQEVEDMVALKATLYGNVAQCLLSQELFRRAADAASKCLELDPNNTKALYRRSLARESLRRWGPALEDMVKLQELGGGSLTKQALEARIELLRGKKEAEERAKDEESSEDEADSALVRMKERFDEVIEKYDLRDGDAAAEVADWLTAGEWLMTTKRVAQRWKMEYEDAEDFIKWIAKGLEFKTQQAEAAAQSQAASPAFE